MSLSNTQYKSSTALHHPLSVFPVSDFNTRRLLLLLQSANTITFANKRSNFSISCSLFPIQAQATGYRPLLPPLQRIWERADRSSLALLLKEETASKPAPHWKFPKD